MGWRKEELSNMVEGERALAEKRDRSRGEGGRNKKKRRERVFSNLI
jgi:hypothetical protein